MTFAEGVAFLFFMGNIIIFFVKMINIMTADMGNKEQPLKFYRWEMSIILFIVAMFAWLFMLTVLSVEAVNIEFLIQNGIPVTEYISYGVFLSLSNIILILSGIFTFAEIVIFGWAHLQNQHQRTRWENPYNKFSKR